MASGGVDEDIYNDLYENENAVVDDNSFLETPVKLADCLWLKATGWEFGARCDTAEEVDSWCATLSGNKYDLDGTYYVYVTSCSSKLNANIGFYDANITTAMDKW